MKKKLILSILILSEFIIASAQNNDGSRLFTESLQQDSCTFLTIGGRNTFFILEPGYQLYWKALQGNTVHDLLLRC